MIRKPSKSEPDFTKRIRQDGAYGAVQKQIRREKEWTSADDERVRTTIEEEVSQLTEQERNDRVWQII